MPRLFCKTSNKILSILKHPYRIPEIARIVEGKVSGDDTIASVEHLITDSRKILFPEASVFFALKGDQHNGHAFIRKAYEGGIRVFIISDETDTSPYSGSCFIRVNNTLDALQQLAAEHRKRFNIPVVGITGSNGKTIVKDWLSFVLSREYVVCKSPKSYNSQVGVPLSVWNLQEEHEIGIFEAGISKPGEMAKLEPVISPQFGIFTNIGSAHEKNFSGTEEKIREKLLLFKHSTHIVLPVLNPMIEKELEKLYPDKLLITWGETDHAQYRFSCKKNTRQTELFLTNGDEDYTFTIPYTDAASIENAVNVFIMALVLNADTTIITEQMLHLPQVTMRLSYKTGKNGNFIIDDTYSNDFDSLKIAIDSLGSLEQYAKKTVILSDLAQSSEATEELYRNLATILTQRKIERVIGIGTEISTQRNTFGNHALFFPDVSAFLQHLPDMDFRDEAILIKGARSFELEKVVTQLENKVHDTVMEVNLNAMIHNLNEYKRKLTPGTRIMAMVKASGYGTGAYEIAHILNFHHVDYLGVAYADEALELRDHGIQVPIMIMNAEATSFDLMVEKKLEPVIYTMEGLRALIAHVHAGGAVPPIHIEIDTGMHRLGFAPGQVEELTELIKREPVIVVQSVFSHLAASDEPGMDNFTLEQIAVFKTATQKIEQALGRSFLKHIANSAGASRFREANFDMIRLGVGLYGVGANAAEQARLEPVISLYSTVAQLTSIKKGDSVGYGRSFIASQDMVIATVPIGYADGYRRSLGNGKGKMFINGQPAPVVGRVCMDMTMIDVTGLDVETGDTVEIIGENQPIESLAKMMETIPYEILTSISQRVRRVYVQE